MLFLPRQFHCSRYPVFQINPREAGIMPAAYRVDATASARMLAATAMKSGCMAGRRLRFSSA
jgi:hypothetical protein